jgi:hypothetical protein
MASVREFDGDGIRKVALDLLDLKDFLRTDPEGRFNELANRCAGVAVILTTTFPSLVGDLPLLQMQADLCSNFIPPHNFKK